MFCEVVRYKRVDRGPLLAYVDIYIPAWRVTFCQIRHYDGERGEGIATPYQLVRSHGQKLKIIEFNSAEDFEDFQSEVLRAIRQYLTGGGRNGRQETQ